MTPGGVVIWVTGLPASGKSTLARAIADRIRAAGREPVVLDGDEVRAVLVPRPGYDPAGRDAYYRTLVGLACLVADRGAIVIVPATAHRRAWRELARTRAPRFVEVHVATPLAECRRRDPKHLYDDLAASAALPGADVEYEPPNDPEVIASDGEDSHAVDSVIARLR